MGQRLPVLVAALAVTLAFAGCTDGDGRGSNEDDASALFPSTDDATADGTFGTIVGRVTNGTGALAGARATLRELLRNATSDGAGEFRFDDVPNGTYELVVELFGYEPAKVPVVLRPGETKNLDVALKRVVTITDRVERWTFDGFMVCGAGAAELAGRCPGLPPGIVTQLENRAEFTFPLRAVGFESVVVEVVWTPTLSAANGICFEVVVLGAQDHEPCGDGGHILWRSDRRDEPGIAPKTSEDVEILLDFFPAWENAQGQPAANVQVQQSFQAYAHVFYGVPARADHSPAAEA